MKRTWKKTPPLTVHIDLGLSDEQNSRAMALAALWGLRRAAAIRRSIDDTYVREVLSNSSDSTNPPAEPSAQ